MESFRSSSRSHSSSTAEALPSPVSLPQIYFMAPFSAPGKVGSMPWTVYPPGVRFDSAGTNGWLCPVVAPLVKKNTRPGNRA